VVGVKEVPGAGRQKNNSLRLAFEQWRGGARQEEGRGSQKNTSDSRLSEGGVVYVERWVVIAKKNTSSHVRASEGW
jgi:hypothetical protein